nr:hypothetical protein [Tanacetum cinerariifolium]
MPLYSQLEGTRLSVDTSEGSAGARIVSRILLRVLFILLMPLYSQLEGTRSSVDTSEGSARARCSSSFLSSSSFSTSS